MLLKDFYKVISSSKETNQFVTEISINKNHPLYKGHFPNRPVTPGVVLMNLFKEETERQVGCLLALQKAVNVKFMAVVDPTSCANLVLETQIDQVDNEYKVKGIARQNGEMALKFNAIYKAI
ncbi:hydroxymyristoyl-ACP dehydratase [Zunongwangia sp.]|uniref:hydroxymyristoyl-ACP dehydratase n=1 Tax=Zunongwangia sp. TaxID=1965325 RepID=UPI003AA92EE3